MFMVITAQLFVSMVTASFLIGRYLISIIDRLVLQSEFGF